MLAGAITVDLDESSFISWILHRRFGDHGEYVFFGTINRYMAQVRQRKHVSHNRRCRYKKIMVFFVFLRTTLAWTWRTLVTGAC